MMTGLVLLICRMEGMKCEVHAGFHVLPVVFLPTLKPVSSSFVVVGFVLVDELVGGVPVCAALSIVSLATFPSISLIRVLPIVFFPTLKPVG